MLIRLASVILALSASVSAADPVREVFYRDTVWSGRRSPFFEGGYLVSLLDSTRMIAHGPDGYRSFDIDVKAPAGEDVSVADVAIDRDGAVAAAVAYGHWLEPRGALVFLNAAGEQVRFVDTGRYTPMAACFSEAHFIWTFGRQRDADDPSREDRKEYMTLRKYAPDGREVGAYLPRASLPPGFMVETTPTWRIRLATDRVGIVGTSIRLPKSPAIRTLIEVDLQGRIFSRWEIGETRVGGLAYTDHHGLYTLKQEGKQNFLRLMFYDRDTSSWKPASDEQYGLYSYLLGADGNDLVIEDRRGIGPNVKWFPAPQ
jgi:hypothetical protein